MDGFEDEVTEELFNRVRGERLQQMAERRRENGRIENEVRLALWIERLNLSEQQAATVWELMDQQLEAQLPTINEEGDLEVKPLPAHGKSIEQESELAVLFDELLNDEQKQALESLQKEQRLNKIESRAARRLADLQTQLDLSEEQKDKIFAIFSQEEAVHADNPTADGPGYEAFLDAGGSHDAWQEFREETARARRDEQVGAVSDILDERQLSAYRQFLERTENRPAVDLGRMGAVGPVVPGK